ncbi:putative lipoprotein [Myxococcus xanthus DK 1622]|uniref:Lipoprotein n=2 Tax=Myxococcaceae TaxID=31 RepID=Q1D1E3_MYXXD|nr:putative lipoprotein [Myxococcus xanthus DK 1622]NOJ54774.1 IPT/TIG domain-containing protein [Myxococcus xanthus]QPM77848.1 IPT/TIG domain-containing protein [Myxococcus xanthus]QVW66916.1 IPT/TIG domain-containing protein [Myxococcus xanthus DZ2]UEO06956.1 IPT/TIG domain-containing protein [Myxococcus xanthus DZ2]
MMSMSSRCLRALVLVLPLLVVACDGDSDGGPAPSDNAPVVREVQPSGGPVSGHTLINVYGAGFKEGAKLYFGQQEALRVVVVNTHRIYGYTPTATSGLVDVRVVNPDSAHGTLVGGFTFEGAPVATIEQAEVLNGNVDAVSNGQPVGTTVRGAVTVAGITRGTGQGGGTRAQVGFALADAELLNPDSYTWEEASYEGDSGSREADIYQGTVLLQPTIGGERREWVVTMRFSIDNGATWVMADGDGSANGVSEDMLRRVFISRPRVDYCKLGPDNNLGPVNVFYRPGDITRVKVAGQVYAAGVTQGGGAGSGLVAQLGYGPADSDPRSDSGWTWVNATYKTDHGNNDEWEADLPNPGTVGTWRVAYRFSISENVWRFCDADGVNDSDEGNLTFSLSKLGTLTVGDEAPKPAVTWCKIGLDRTAPEAINYTTTQTSGLKTVYAQVNLPGVTDREGAGPGLAGQLGWGPVGEDPRTSSRWNWSTQLTFDQDNFEVNDQWKGTLPNPAINGEYRYAVRFNHDGGPIRVCDGNGVDDGGQNFEMDQLGTLNVTGQPVIPRVIGYCKLGPNENNTPQSLAYTTGDAASHVIIASVNVAGLTNTTTGEVAAIVGQLGWGPAGEAPATSDEWDWTTTAQFKGDFWDNDEYEATLPNPGVVGSYRFAYRFQVNGGEFLYCDADGNSSGPDGFNADLTGSLAVSEAPDPEPTDSYCRLQSVSDTTVGSGDIVTVVGRVHIPSVTAGEGSGANVQVQVGVGAADTNASTQADAFTWKAAEYTSEAAGEADTDEFSTTVTPAYTGDRAVSLRYTTDGTTWTYCDKDGSNVGGYTLGQQHALTVGNHAEIEYCKLQHPFEIAVDAIDGARTVYGRLYHGGVTPGGGQGAGVVAELGYGPASSDPGISGWTWVAASYNGDSGGDDEYAANLPEGVPVGTSYTYRYSYNGGPYCFGDWQPGGEPGGSANGVSPNTLGTVIP